MIKALFKFSKVPAGSVVVDTTSNNHPVYRELSPFILPAPPAKNLENLWQFSKVYPSQVDSNGEPTEEWGRWQRAGWNDSKAHRYPMGKGTIPLYSFWNGEHLDYIKARKRIYAPEYARYVVRTNSFRILREQYMECELHNKELILLDYDAYDHILLNQSLVDVINNPEKKMGHAFVLIMMLTGVLQECIESP